MAEIVLNGQPRAIQPNTTVSELLAGLDMPEDGVAVAIDSEVIPKSAHPQTVLRDGAKVEVIRAVGGG